MFSVEKKHNATVHYFSDHLMPLYICLKLSCRLTANLNKQHVSFLYQSARLACAVTLVFGGIIVHTTNNSRGQCVSPTILLQFYKSNFNGYGR